MFRLYRDIQPGEFFVVFGDAAQGGDDANFVQFLSKTRMDFPLVLDMQGVAAEATPHVRQALEWIYDQTGVKPVFAWERNNGGASEMHNLNITNQQGKFDLYHAKTEDDKDRDILGFNTNTVTRPNMLGEWLTAFNSKTFKIYDQKTIDQHHTFIVNKRTGKPEADVNTHDDAVLSCSGAYQLYQTENPRVKKTHRRAKPNKLKFHVGG